MNDYDVIVVGSGIGGLTGAAVLSQAGQRVLVLERNNVPGGYAQTFIRGRFEFDASMHWLSGMGEPGNRGPLGILFDKLGVSQRLHLIPSHEFIHCVTPQIDITLPFGVEAARNHLCEEFPSERNSITKLFTELSEIWREQATLPQGQIPFDVDRHRTLIKYQGRSVAEVFKEYFSDPRLKMVLAQAGNYFAQPFTRVAFADYAQVLGMFLNYGASLITGKSQALSQSLTDVIMENGGDVWLNNGVSRILVGEKGIRGVITEQGQEISCSYVLSNADPVHTCFNLIGAEQVPLAYLDYLQGMTPGGSIFSVYLGLDCNSRDLGIEAHTTFNMAAMPPGPDFLEGGAMAFQFLQEGQFLVLPGLAIANYNATDPDYSPPGTSVLTLNSLTWGSTWLRMNPRDYSQAKNSAVEMLLGMAEKAYPGLRSHIETMDAATSLTNLRYTGNWGGSYVGFAETRLVTPRRISLRGPIEGLYFASGWVYGGGIPMCAAAGADAAQCILQDSKTTGISSAVVPETSLSNTPEVTIEQHLDLEMAAEAKTLAGLHPGLLNLKIVDIIKETPTTSTLRLVSSEGDPLPPFRSGQYINLFVNINGTATSRPYAISSSPERPYYDITVKRKPGGFVSIYLLDCVQVGDRFTATEPCGNFTHNPLTDTEDLVLLAGGSGITPFVSMIRGAVETGLPLRFHLIAGINDPTDMIFYDELMRITAENNNVRVDWVVSQPTEQWSGETGFLDKERIEKLVGTVAGKTFFIAGPPEMHMVVNAALKELGIPEKQVHRESYTPAPITSEISCFQCLEERSGRSFMARADEPLMISLERAGLLVPTICRAGECLACRTKLIKGVVYVPDNIHRRLSDQQADYIHPCVTYPRGDLCIRL
ncbi:MAG: FAD-dependent oxidoreductase [Chitinophagales bacterium]